MQDNWMMRRACKTMEYMAQIRQILDLHTLKSRNIVQKEPQSQKMDALVQELAPI